MTRHGLLATAVATVTVPGLLAILAVQGHEHVTAKAGAASSLTEVPLSGSLPEAPTTARGAVRDDVAAVQQVWAAPVTVLNKVTTGQQAMGRHLLDQAANASLATSYQGTEQVSQSGVAGSVTMVSEIWHKGGGPTLVATSDGPATAAPATAVVASSDPASGSPEGVFGVTKDLVTQLVKHYVAVYTGGSSVAGKPARVVELHRFDGSLAARYWLDRQTSLPLRRELFDTSDKVISEDSFVQVQVGTLDLPARQRGQVPQSQAPWVTAGLPAKFLTSLTGQGWQMPTALPGGLPLYAAASTKATSGEIVDLEYSDGLYVVSLFVQRGTLAPDMPGWRQVKVAGQQAFVAGHSVTWAGHGFVYTVIADAPPQTVAQVVTAVPGSSSPGVLSRLGRGLLRLANVVNPFG